MANAEHLKILKEGVEVWNRWRKKNRKVHPDLSGGDLSNTDLSGADLSRADLRNVILVRARLVGANLSLANLANADLRSADMEGVNLQKADLSGAKLNYAPPQGGSFSDGFRIRTNLRNADLRRANLTNADIQGALIDGALLIKVNLTGANLSETSGKAIYKKPAPILPVAGNSKAIEGQGEKDIHKKPVVKPVKQKNRTRTVDSEIDHHVRDVIIEPYSGYKKAVQSAKTENTLQFDGIYPSPFRPNTWQDLLIYVYYKSALEKVIADFERRKQQLAGAFTGTSAESQSHIPPDSLLTIIPDIPSVVCEPPSFQFRMTDDYHCQPFRVMHKTTPVLEKLGRGRIKGAVRIYLETLVIGEIPVESEWEMPGYVAPVQPTMVSSFAAQPQMMTATTGESFKRQTAQTFRKIFASYSDADTPIVERLEKAYKALGDDYWLQFQRLRSGQDRSKVIEEAIKNSDVFQLCWSNNAKTAENVEREWRVALVHGSENFIRPIYWEKPMPEPPEELRHLYFDYYQVET